jgi:hypothetical protein
MQISKHVTLEQMTFSETATRDPQLLHLQQNPPKHVVDSLSNVATHMLDCIFEEIGKFNVTSGYRSPQLNTLIKGSKSSQHILGEACDLQFASLDPRVHNDCVHRALTKNVDLKHGSLNFLAFLFIAGHYKFDQLIHEYGTNGAPAWVHVSLSMIHAPRNQILIINHEGTRIINLYDAYALGA